MKLIQILALATAMATMATAQNSGANSQTTPTPTPAVAGKSGGTTKPAKKKTAGSATKAGTATPASTGPAVKVKTTSMPVKGQTAAGAPAKGTPTPAVAAKATDTKEANAKKTDAKKADAKKADAARAPAVIAVKPTKETKKAGPTQAKAPVETLAAPKVTQATPPPKPAEKPKPSPRTFGSRGRRDPFVSPIVADKGIVNHPPPNCSGKKCLVIPELVLQGTVKDTSGKMMAVVANGAKKISFLRENDQVFQGSVEKITSDSIIFREYVKDALGRETAREVVKKLVPPS
jgi:Tfp pilus assembly protein PilP